MSWTLSIPATTADRFDATVDLVLQREAGALSRVGATHAAEIAAIAAKELVREWDVTQVAGRTVGAILKGEANPGGNAPAGFPNDAIEIKLWRSS